jgi:hypothetical protein
MNCGHHPAAESHFTYPQYSQLVTEFFGEISKQNNVYKLMWVENVAVPIHQDKGNVGHKDWRTYHRLLLFDYIAQKKIKESKLQIAIIPAFLGT